jgi:exosortase A
MTERLSIPKNAKRMRTIGWRLGFQQGAAYIIAAVGIVALHAIFFDTVSTTVSTWINSATFNHGVLIPALIAYLVWQRRELLAQTAPKPNVLGLSAFAVAAAIWLVGKISETTIVQQAGFAMMIPAFVLGALGRPVARVLRFPLFYLIFAVPFGAELVPYLQDITAFFVVFFLQQVGIPVYLDGVFLSTPAGNYLVAEACSGVRYLISTIALGTFFAHMVYRSWARQALFVALCVAVPIVANGIRAFLIVLIAYLSDNEIAVGIDHIVYGWVFFSIVTFLLLGLGLVMRERGASHYPSARAKRFDGRASFGGAIAATATALSIAAFTSAYADHIAKPTANAAQAELTLPAFAAIPEIGVPEVEWSPRFASPDATISKAYVFEGRTIRLDVGYYNYERPGAKAVTSDHDIEGSSWQSAQVGTIKVELAGETLPLRFMRLRASGRFKQVWYWYWVGGEFTGSPYKAKYLRTKALLTGGQTATAILVLSTDYVDASERPDKILRDFLNSDPTALRTMLGRAARR